MKRALRSLLPRVQKSGTRFRVKDSGRRKGFNQDDEHQQRLNEFCWRQMYHRMHYLQGPWRPATFVSLLQNKSQLMAGLMSCALGRLYLFECNKVVYADQLNGGYPESVQAGLWTSTVETVMLIFRAVYLIILFTPALLLAGFAENCEGRTRVIWLRLLLRTLQSAGPTFIKWGQWAATRPDIFPLDVCEELCKLHNKAPKHSFQVTKRIVEEAFRCPIEEVFESFSEEPKASGSIAQVHRATLRRNAGKDEQVVAVKVRHPTVCREIHRDFRIIKWLARLSTFVPALKYLQLDKSAHHFASFMIQQVDLSLEAAHLTRFIYNFRNARGVIFPEPKYPFVHPAVLVETFEEGRSIGDYIVDGAQSRIHTRLAELGTKTLLKMLLIDNFIHGDLHPGNVFVRFRGKSPQLVLLDVGMTAELSEKNRVTLVELFKGVAERDGYKVARSILEFSDNQDGPQSETFKQDVDAKFRKHLTENGNAQSTGECMLELFDEIRKHHVNIDGDVCTVMITTLVLEGWQRKLDPDFDILNVLGSILHKMHNMDTLEYTMLAIAAP